MGWLPLDALAMVPSAIDVYLATTFVPGGYEETSSRELRRGEDTTARALSEDSLRLLSEDMLVRPQNAAAAPAVRAVRAVKLMRLVRIARLLKILRLVRLAKGVKVLRSVMRPGSPLAVMRDRFVIMTVEHTRKAASRLSKRRRAPAAVAPAAAHAVPCARARSCGWCGSS